jgi:hypothetical protein
VENKMKITKTQIKQIIRNEIKSISLKKEAEIGRSSITVYKTPKAFSKSTKNAMDIDKEDDDVEESMAAQFRKRKFRGLGRPIKVGLNEDTSPEQLLKQLGSELKRHDWWYMMSDDHRYYVNGTRHMDTIRKIIGMVNKAGQSKSGEKLWNKLAPKPFHGNYPSDLKETINERVASPFSEHLRNAQDEIEYMISEHGEAEGEGVYSNPAMAIKLLMMAQKSLSKIK